MIAGRKWDILPMAMLPVRYESQTGGLTQAKTSIPAANAAAVRFSSESAENKEIEMLKMSDWRDMSLNTGQLTTHWMIRRSYMKRPSSPKTRRLSTT